MAKRLTAALAVLAFCLIAAGPRRNLPRWPDVNTIGCTGSIAGFASCASGGAAPGSANTAIVVDSNVWVSPEDNGGGALTFNLAHCTDSDSNTKCNFAEAVCRSNATVTFSISGAIDSSTDTGGVRSEGGVNSGNFGLNDCPAAALPIHNLTIDASTAPGAGVYLTGWDFEVNGSATNIIVKDLRFRGVSTTSSLGAGISITGGCSGCAITHPSIAFAQAYGGAINSQFVGNSDEPNINDTWQYGAMGWSHIFGINQRFTTASNFSFGEKHGQCHTTTAQLCCVSAATLVYDGTNETTKEATIGGCPGVEVCDPVGGVSAGDMQTECYVANTHGKVFSIPGQSAALNLGAACDTDWDAQYGICSAYCAGTGANLGKRAAHDREGGQLGSSSLTFTRRFGESSGDGICEGGTLNDRPGSGPGTCPGGGTFRHECPLTTDFGRGPFIGRGPHNFGFFAGGADLKNLSFFRNLGWGFKWRFPNLSPDSCTEAVPGTPPSSCPPATSNYAAYDIVQNVEYGGRYLMDSWTRYMTRSADIVLDHNFHDINYDTRGLYSDILGDLMLLWTPASSGSFVGTNPNHGTNVRYYFNENFDRFHSVGDEGCSQGGGTCGTAQDCSWSSAETTGANPDNAGCYDGESALGYFGQRGPLRSYPAFPGTFDLGADSLKMLLTGSSATTGAGATLPCEDAVDRYAKQLMRQHKALRVMFDRDEVGGPQQDMSVCPSVVVAWTPTVQSKTGASAIAVANGSGVSTATFTVSTTEARMLKMHAGIEDQGAFEAHIRDPRVNAGTLTIDFDVGTVAAATNLADGCYPARYWVSIGDWLLRGIGLFEVKVGAGSCVADVTAPVISSIVVSNVTVSAADIAWTTNEASNSVVNYGPTVSYGTTSTGAPLVTSHSRSLSGLNNCITYHYKVASTDAATNTASSADATFTTLCPDTTPPTITGEVVTQIAETTAAAAWDTDESSDSQIKYGTTIGYLLGPSPLGTNMILHHQRGFVGLPAGILIHWCAQSRDVDGNLSLCTDKTFTTAAAADITAPTISVAEAATQITDTSAVITWGTDELSDSRVEFGTSALDGVCSGDCTTLDTNLVTNHSVSLSGLTQSTNYKYRIHSKDAAGNEVVSAVDKLFATIATPDITAPVISAISSNSVSASSANVTWTTNEPATSRVQYDDDIAFGSSALTALNSSLFLTHSEAITGLASCTIYYYKVISVDAASNSATSSANSFTTTGCVAGGPACTIGPYTSATSLATIDTAIDGAANGAVVCLRRGNTWTAPGQNALTLSTSHPDGSRVTICSSDDTQCTRSSGGANAKIQMTDGAGSQIIALGLTSTVSGYTFQDINFYDLVPCDDLNDRMMPALQPGNDNFTFRGGVWSGWSYWVVGNGTNAGSDDPSNIRMGDGPAGDRLEITGCSYTGIDLIPAGGRLDDLFVAVYLHDWGANFNTGGIDHIFSFNYGASICPGTTRGTFEANRVTFQYNQWDFDQAHSTGSIIRLARGTDLVMKDNVFQIISTMTECRLSGPGFHSHGGTSCGVANAELAYWDRGLIENNLFALGDCNHPGIENKHGSDVTLRNNVFDLSDKTSQQESWGTAIESPAPGSMGNHNNFKVYNNTVYAPINQSNSPTVEFNSAATGMAFYNNVIVEGHNPAAPVAIGSCSWFGTNGVNITNNFVNTPNDSTPDTLGCSAAQAWLPGGLYNTAPGFVDAPNGNFDITNGGPLDGTGTTTGQPPTDKDGRIRTDADIGAYTDD